MRSPIDWLGRHLTHWLVRDGPPPPTPLCDFDRLRFELRPADVILVEGRSRVSEVIRMVTQSPWSHAALYIGRLFDLREPRLRAAVEGHFEGDPEEQLIIEALMGEGTLIAPLAKYRQDHVRICRPAGLAPEDAQRIVAHAVSLVGRGYDMRHVLDLARFLFPWGLLPRRWRSTLFQHNAGEPTRTLCSSLIAESFNQVDFPILPFIDRGGDGGIRFFKRNPKLFAPSDFDYSPYFEIIKYPFLGLDELALYRRLPWNRDGVMYNDAPQEIPTETVARPALVDGGVKTPEET